MRQNPQFGDLLRNAGKNKGNKLLLRCGKLKVAPHVSPHPCVSLLDLRVARALFS
ncbi:hypothetical protein GCM10007094_08900 [Pseudovibrio japonicus]|uniref:Uncharacterized protein n=1 Tax=Pseudovibrio japonicus TaxID=366534 RepID=A0ABQ3E8N6_9HYPH|nr:hypothetical protein GCM10007094_08900 [Pseudovibrio japonicus]